MITIEELNKIYEETDRIRKDYPNLRYGQAFYNVLHNYHPNVAKLINGTEYDPFYNDNVLDKCINKIVIWEI